MTEDIDLLESGGQPSFADAPGEGWISGQMTNLAGRPLWEHPDYLGVYWVELDPSDPFYPNLPASRNGWAMMRKPWWVCDVFACQVRATSERKMVAQVTPHGHDIYYTFCPAHAKLWVKEHK